MVSESVEIRDVDPDVPTERIRQIIRDEYLRDSTETEKIRRLGNRIQYTPYKKQLPFWAIRDFTANISETPRGYEQI